MVSIGSISVRVAAQPFEESRIGRDLDLDNLRQEARETQESRVIRRLPDDQADRPGVVLQVKNVLLEIPPKFVSR